MRDGWRMPDYQEFFRLLESLVTVAETTAFPATEGGGQHCVLRVLFFIRALHFCVYMSPVCVPLFAELCAIPDRGITFDLLLGQHFLNRLLSVRLVLCLY